MLKFMEVLLETITGNLCGDRDDNDDRGERVLGIIESPDLRFVVNPLNGYLYLSFHSLSQ